MPKQGLRVLRLHILNRLMQEVYTTSFERQAIVYRFCLQTLGRYTRLLSVWKWKRDKSPDIASNKPLTAPDDSASKKPALEIEANEVLILMHEALLFSNGVPIVADESFILMHEAQLLSDGVLILAGEVQRAVHESLILAREALLLSNGVPILAGEVQRVVDGVFILAHECL